MPTLDTLHVDEALTNISIAYRNEAFVAEQLLPVVPVQKRRDIYFKFSKQHFVAEDDTYYPGSHAKRIEVDLEKRGYYDAHGHALEAIIPDEFRENADPGAQIDIEFTEKLAQKIALKQEVNASALLAAANVPNNTTLSGTSQWSDYTNSDPVTVVDQAKETIQQLIGVVPNSLFLPRPVFRTLRNHPRIIDRVKYTGLGARKALTGDDLAEVFEVDRVVVPQVIQSTAHVGQTDTLSYVYGKLALLFYVPKSPGLRTPSFGYTFVWKTGYQVKRYREEGTDADIIKVKKWYDLKIVESNAAYLWLSAVA